MWNIEEIKEKRKIVNDKLKKCSNAHDKEALALTSLAYLRMLCDTKLDKSVKIYKLMDKLTCNKFTLIKNRKYNQMEADIVNNLNQYVDYDFKDFLMQICKNVLNDNPKYDDIEYTKVAVDVFKIKDTSKNFYASLGDFELLSKALKTLNTPSLLNFVYGTHDRFDNCRGMTYLDYVYENAYCVAFINGDLLDYQTLNHEIMHSVDFYSNSKMFTDNYYGFHEVSTYTVDYLFWDFLESEGYSKESVDLLRQARANYLASLARHVYTEYNGIRQAMKAYGIDEQVDFDINMLKDLLELESAIIAYILYNKIKADNKLGLSDLKKFMKTKLDPNKTPDFNFIGISNDDILLASKTLLSNISKNNNKGKLI